jgi:hypothetical protein
MMRASEPPMKVRRLTESAILVAICSIVHSMFE